MGRLGPMVAAGLVPALVLAGLPSRHGGCYTPESPVVKQMVGRAVSFLEKSQPLGNAGKLGGRALIALAIYKKLLAEGQPSALARQHPKVQDAFRFAQASVAGGGEGLQSQEVNYSLGLATIFLAEVFPDSPILHRYVQEVLRRQQPWGAWGYPGAQQGDTSQIQYPILGLWSAPRAGVDVPGLALERACNWLIRTQDPSGMWGYQGNDPGTFTRVRQQDRSPSLTAAGVGSLYVLVDFFGLSKGSFDPKERKKSETIKLPPALIPVIGDKPRRRKGPGAPVVITQVRVDLLRRAIADADAWFAQNFRITIGDWQFYFMYAYERYQAFKEVAEDRYEKEPAWYNQGVEYLRKVQASDGSFEGTGGSAGKEVDTAFAVLFLLRSTRKMLEQHAEAEGVLVGGRGLPKNIGDARLTRDFKVVAPPITGAVEDLLTLLEEDEKGEQIEELLDHPDVLSVRGLQGSGREYRDRLIRILRSGSYQARILAARILGRQGDLDNVPALIYALTDPDPRVVREAHDGLRLTSRRFEGIELPETFTPEQLERVIQQWKAWYRAIRPDAVFLD